jgi:hypothetical protein
MSRRCPECKRGRLEIVGMGDLEDTILVECPECGAELELEPDGLGEGGLEMVEAFEAEQKRRQQEVAEEAKATKQVYGFTIPESVTTYWSARGIYTWRDGEVNTDILPDRQTMNGAEDKAAAKDLADWLNKDGLPGLQAVCQRESIQPDETRIAEYRAQGYFVAGNPNGSHGYLYVIAYREASPC